MKCAGLFMCAPTRHSPAILSRKIVERMQHDLTLRLELDPEFAGQTLAAVLRSQLPGYSWNDVRKVIAARRAKIDGELVLDPARRVKEGQTVELLARSAPVPRQ